MVDFSAARTRIISFNLIYERELLFPLVLILSQILTTRVSKLVGARVKSVGASRVLLGRTNYVDDIHIPGMLYLSFARSSVSHAKLNSVNLGKVLSEVEVVGAISCADILDEIKPFPILASPKGLRSIKKYPLALGKIRYVGEIVAGILSHSRAFAEDLSELVEVDYEQLPSVTNPEDAVKQDSPLVIDEWGSNEAFSMKVRRGDVERTFSEADHVVSRRFRIQRQYGAPMEPRGVVADYEPATDSLTLYSSTQWPHIVRTVLSQMLDLGEHKIRVISPDVGGGFGNKQDVYPEEVLAAYFSKKLKRPVKWVAGRSEDMLSTVHARDQIHYFEIASSRDGTLLGVKDRIIADLGAFHTMSLGPQLVSVGALPGAYKIKNWDVSLSCVVTNKTPVGAYRGFGASEANFALERAVDIVSHELRMDPAKLRLKNFISSSEFPYETPLGAVYDSGNYAECLMNGLALVGYEKFKESQARLRSEGKFEGIGLSFVVESTGIGSSRQMALDGFKVYSGFDSATLRIERSGSITVLTGLCPHGQGLDTTLAQVCADEFGVRVEDVRVLWGDTQSAPYGFGTWGSRSAITGSTVVKLSADKVKAKARLLAAHILKVEKDEIRFDSGIFRSGKEPEKSISLFELAEIAYSASDLPVGMEPGLEATSFYDPPGPSYSFGVHIALVSVDIETGFVSIKKYFVSHDCGTIINPSIVEGQLHGGVAQGIAGALFEELKYDEDGQFVSGNFMNYLLPTSSDVPDIATSHTVTPSKMNPLGVKGMGEGGAIAPPAAIANAVEDALSHLGIRISETPLTPDMILGMIKKSR